MVILFDRFNLPEDIFEVIFKKIFSKRIRIELPFRCDSPDCRRFMRMQISYSEANQLTFRNRIMREENRPAVALLFNPRPASGKLLRMCSWCKKIQTANETWHEVETAVGMLGLFDEFPLPQITHSICKPCSVSLLSKIDSL